MIRLATLSQRLGSEQARPWPQQQRPQPLLLSQPFSLSTCFFGCPSPLHLPLRRQCPSETPPAVPFPLPFLILMIISYQCCHCNL